MEWKFEIETKARGKERPRVNTMTKQAYTPHKTKNYEDLIKYMFLHKYGVKTKPSEKEIALKIIATFEPPKSLSKKKRQELIDGEFGYLHKPDTDNIAKAVLDALNKVVYKDDNQVANLLVIKKYGATDKVEIEIKEL
jgi:Holliday junction resolvase RusA-like endonuclease